MGAELAEFLAEQSRFPSKEPSDRHDLAKVSSYYSDVAGPHMLRDEIRRIFSHHYECGPIHKFLASVPANLLFVVTNYDTLLEQAFDAVKRPYDLAVYPSDRNESAGTILWKPYGASEFDDVKPNKLRIDLSRASVIFKMHGTIAPSPEWDSYVITEEDYVGFLLRMTGPNRAVPAVFLEHFQSRNFLFLGYSLRDWNLRVVLETIKTRDAVPNRRSTPSWAIQWKVSDLERYLWQNRGVTIFDIPLNEFVIEMERMVGS